MTIQKFHLYSLKVSAHVKISVECFENSRGRKFPPPAWLRACLADITIFPGTAKATHCHVFHCCYPKTL